MYGKGVEQAAVRQAPDAQHRRLDPIQQVRDGARQRVPAPVGRRGERGAEAAVVCLRGHREAAPERSVVSRLLVWVRGLREEKNQTHCAG